MEIYQKQNFCLNLAIIIVFLLTYSVYEKVKKINKFEMKLFSKDALLTYLGFITKAFWMNAVSKYRQILTVPSPQYFNTDWY